MERGVLQCKAGVWPSHLTLMQDATSCREPTCTEHPACTRHSMLSSLVFGFFFFVVQFSALSFLCCTPVTFTFP